MRKYDFYELVHTMYVHNLGHTYRSAYIHILVTSTDLTQAVKLLKADFFSTENRI